MDALLLRIARGQAAGNGSMRDVTVFKCSGVQIRSTFP